MEHRASGVLMHISSLPGPFGIGTFGQSAYDFVDFLKQTKQTYWQILPLTTTSYGDSPYQSFSANAGNTHFIDFEVLAQDGLLTESDWVDVDFGDNPESIDYEKIYYNRRPILEKAVQNFLSKTLPKAFETFLSEQEGWLQDFAEFMAIKESYNNVSLQDWPDDLARKRDTNRLGQLRQELAETINYHKVTQYFFFSQWQDLKAYANDQGIKIIGDMPIYVAGDSVEVWTMPNLFKLDENLKLTHVAGCPPDDFSDVGQLWGNPIYDWSKHAETGFAWWIYRIQESLKLYDVLRIDHFKGFSDFWEIDGETQIPKEGHWVSGPGYALFEAVKKALGDLPIIAEDLGYIDDKARRLLADTGFPGMKVLEFAFYDTDASSVDIPFNAVPHGIAYIGTHDNDVVNGWYDTLTENQVAFLKDYANVRPGQPVYDFMLRQLFATVSQVAIPTMQDILNKPASSRMNTPNTLGGNWQWRMLADDITDQTQDFLKHLTELYGRVNPAHK